jgi:predicted ATPase
VDIPDTVQAVLTARIDLLEPVEKWVLRSAAVVGKEFWGGPVSRLLDDQVMGGAGAVEEVLSRLEERGLIVARLSSMMEGEREYAFRHILTRDVAYESLPRRERSEAHARVAGWIRSELGSGKPSSRSCSPTTTPRPIEWPRTIRAVPTTRWRAFARMRSTMR